MRDRDANAVLCRYQQGFGLHPIVLRGEEVYRILSWQAATSLDSSTLA